MEIQKNILATTKSNTGGNWHSGGWSTYQKY